MIQYTIFRSVFRLLPTFILASALGCLIGYYVFHIPHGLLGVVVSVPLVVTFIITRVLVLALPMSGGNDSARPRPTLFSLSIAVPIFVGMSLSFAMLPSPAVYALIGLREIAKGSLELSAAGLLLGLGSFVLAITIAVFASKPVANLLQFVWLKTVELFWNVLRFPTEISIRIYGDFGRPMSPSH